MRAAAIISVVFHVAVISAAWIGVPVLFRNTDFVESPLLVELVMIDDVTTTREQAAEAEPEPEPVKRPERRPPPPPPEQVAALEPEPVPTPVVKPEAVAPPQVAPPPTPKPTRRVTEPPNRKPTPPSRDEPFDANRIVALIDRSRQDEPPPPPPPEPEEEPEAEPEPFRLPEIRREPVNEGVRVSALPLTISELDAIRLQIQKCWSVPAGARDAENLVVRIRFSLNPDGSLRGEPKILDRDRMDEPSFRTAAESARRAVLRCTPLTLPPAKYESWKDIVLNFNPRDLLGG